MRVTHVTTAQFARMLIAEMKRRRTLFTPADKAAPGSALTLAERAGYYVYAVRQWENGHRQPSLREALDCLEASVGR